MATVTSGAANSVAGNPTSDTRPKCHATIGAVASVAPTPAASPPLNGRGILHSHAASRRLRMGGATMRRPNAPANESWKPGQAGESGSTRKRTSRLVATAPNAPGGRVRHRETETKVRISAARVAASGNPIKPT